MADLRPGRAWAPLHYTRKALSLSIGATRKGARKTRCPASVVPEIYWSGPDSWAGSVETDVVVASTGFVPTASIPATGR